MQLAGWENVENDFILLDSGATHGLRPAVDDDEWTKAERTTQIKTAQAIAGALLWLNTRTRPDISVGVSTVCRLATKNPAKAIEIGMNVMAYIRKRSGGSAVS
jgi:hypothetical protein